MEQLQGIMFTLNSIKEDVSVPKNVRFKINEAISYLNNNDQDSSLKISKALQRLDDISNDPNLPMYTRVEVLNIIGILGSFQY